MHRKGNSNADHDWYDSLAPGSRGSLGDLEIDAYGEPPADLNMSVDEAAAESFLESVRTVAPELDA